MQVRAAADLERRQVVNEVKRQVEKEKEIAISETKKKKWVSGTSFPLPVSQLFGQSSQFHVYLFL